jgi:Ca2+/Na+ antiporter
MVLCGMVGFLLFILGWVADLNEGIQAIVMLATLVLTVVYTIVSVERNLKRKFPDDRA